MKTFESLENAILFDELKAFSPVYSIDDYTVIVLEKEKIVIK